MIKKKICVFCGTNFGKKEEYKNIAKSLGEYIAKNGHTLIYGGGKLGLMGEVAQSCASNGGEIIGIIPSFLMNLEGINNDLITVIEVENLNIRKEKMVESSDAFIALPGGFGTLEEICDILSWSQLGIHDKPLIFLNIEGYFSPQIEMIRKTMEDGFAPTGNLDLFHEVKTIEEAFDKIENFKHKLSNKFGL